MLSQSSDEKMDTGSESFRSQDTPNSILSSDFDDKSESNVLRLHNPENGVLRLSEPEHDTQKNGLTDSFLNKMSNLRLDSPLRPESLGISPVKKTNLVLTNNHPLMIVSPEYPDVIPKNKAKEQDLSLSSIEDDRPNENGYGFYTPNTNNSKNNLYFSDNFTTAESQILSNSRNVTTLDNVPPDVARVEKQRRKIIPKFVDTPPKMNHSKADNTPHRVLGRIVDGNRDENAITKYVDAINKRLTCSTPKTSLDDDDENDVDNRVAEWCESTRTRSGPNFDLPIELSANVAVSRLESPDVLSSPTSERSQFEALLDPRTGRAALRPTCPGAPAGGPSPGARRRKIMLPPEDDRCSLDSVSVSLESEDEPPEIEVDEKPASDEDNKRSKSSNTCSECSDPIPEYSLAEELYNERSYVSVKNGDTHATIDMKVIEPFKRVLSHGGYDAEGSAIIVLSACHLPDTSRPDYRYVMDNLFLYVTWSLDRLIGSEYVLVYLHGSAGAGRLPSCRWLHECYTNIHRRLRKSLKHLYLVHPTFWLKSFVMITKPFVSSKFFRKLSYVHNLDQLFSSVPVQPNAIPDAVRLYDQSR